MSIAVLPLAGMVLGAPALFALGISTSPHCAVMCSPIVQMLHQGPSKPTARSMLLLNVGRISSYAALGAVAGAFGGQLLLVAEHWNAGSLMRIAAAAFLVVFGSLQWRASRPRPACCMPRVAPRSWPAYCKGLAWGMLPCPLLYAVLGLAALTGSAHEGAVLLLAFGAGTAPLLIGIGAVTHAALFKNAENLRRASALMMVVAGLWIAATTWPLAAGWSAFCHRLI
ncbi:sulfite exporter TauE/SafE family protein [Hydrocarboniphaga sp.]|uniref:sulfite exporter TauE/SafE family protein n=1 Tax=Hydrocarboniphaga sp. TaxID=2033016 RepID=UPI003D11E0D5